MGEISGDLGVGIWSTVLLSSFILLIVAIWSIFNKPFSSTERLAWILVVLFVPILGSIIYFIFMRSPNSKDKIKL